MSQPARTRRQFASRGATLIEGLIVLTTAATVLGAAAPSMEAARERRQLEGAAAQLETDIQYARSLAVAQDRNLRLSFATTADGTSCYVVHTGAAGTCRCGSTEPVCETGVQAYRQVLFTASDAVSVQANVSGMVFDATKATVTPTGTARLMGRSGLALHKVVNLMGRVRTCSPDGALPGYRAC